MMHQKKKALWWFAPSLLEPMDGPWGSMNNFGHDPVACWRAIIDWLAVMKVDRIFTGIEPYYTDRVCNQWGFHYVCRFPDDPAARCFDDAVVDDFASRCRAICAYGMERGVRIGIHHYNLMAPLAWVEGHPELHEKWSAVCDPVWGQRFSPDRMGWLAANICWNDAEYRAFLQRCWRELFERIPELSGILMTAGEHNYCQCAECTGGIRTHIFSHYSGTSGADLKKRTEEEKTRTKHRAAMCLDVIKTFQATMDSCNKEAVVRTWVIKHLADQLPVGPEYAVKYSVFDACYGGPDPMLEKWLNAGHAMWETAAIEAENCGPLMWHDEAWCRETASKLNELNTIGTLVHINHQWGHQGHLSSFFSKLNITRFLEALEPCVAGPSSTDEFKTLFDGDTAKVAENAARDIAAFPLNMTALVHLQGEGFSWGMPPWFDGAWRWPGVLGTPNYDPPAWANPQGWITFYTLLELVRKNPQDFEKYLRAESSNVLGVIGSLERRLQEAWVRLNSASAPKAAEACSEWRTLRLCVPLAASACGEYAALLRARLAWEACKVAPADSDFSGRAREAAIHWMDESIRYLKQKTAPQLELAQRYPAILPQIAETYRDHFHRLSHATQIKIRMVERSLLVTTAVRDAQRAFTLSFWDYLPSVRPPAE